MSVAALLASAVSATVALWALRRAHRAEEAATRAEAAARATTLLLVRHEASWGRRHDVATLEGDAAGMLLAMRTQADIDAARRRLDMEN